MATKSDGDKKVPVQKSSGRGFEGMTDEDKLKMGRGLAKVAAQKRSGGGK